MEPSKEENEAIKLQEKILIDAGVNSTDIEKLKEGEYSEINEETKKILHSLGVTERLFEENEKSEGKNEEIINEIVSIDRGHSLSGIVQKIETLHENEVEEAKINPREEVEAFLRERSLSESLIKTLVKVGCTEEFVRLLKAIGFLEEDIKELQKLWKTMATAEKESESSISASSSAEYLSNDGIYLKNQLSRPLKNALREVIAKKPFDPVEYLGHWLLNYKICEERVRRQRELDLDVMIERERFNKIDLEDEMVTMKYEEDEEEFFDDWNFLDYD